MEHVQFWGKSFAQLGSLPPEVRSAFAWAILELERDPSVEPMSRSKDLATESVRGISGFYRIAVGTSTDPPGYRALYYVHGLRVFFLRFRLRDPTTYRGLRKDLRKLFDELQPSR